MRTDSQPPPPAPAAPARAALAAGLLTGAAAGAAAGVAAAVAGAAGLAIALPALAAAGVAGPLAAWIARTLAGRAAEVAAARERVRAELAEQRRAAELDHEGLLAAGHAAREEAERADRTRDEFVATVSHELRTPLNTVLGFARLLRMGRLDAAATARAIESIERSASSQAQIVDDLLDVSKIIRGELRLDVRPVELVPVVEAALDAIRPAAAARRIDVAAVLAPAAGPVAGDPGRLQQVVWNLLANAVKFTPPGGRVEVRLDGDLEQVAIRVKDTGAGIPPHFVPHLFERFRQADASSTRSHGGLGLGLAIVRHLVEAHGGTVEAASDGAGRGSTFTVRLPVSAARPRRLLPSEPRVRLDGAMGAVAAAPLASLSRVHVLVVDDDPDTLEVVRQVLEQAGARVTAAGSAEEALRALEGGPADVLLSDIGMPGEDGYALIRRVRGLAPARGGGIPAAALTAYAQPDDRRQALAAGFQAWLSKPVEPAALTAAVARLAGRMM